jgi:hypothetical protein
MLGFSYVNTGLKRLQLLKMCWAYVVAAQNGRRHAYSSSCNSKYLVKTLDIGERVIRMSITSAK